MSSVPTHPTPCTLRPAPYTSHPTPYTLHLTPYTLHPELTVSIVSLPGVGAVDAMRLASGEGVAIYSYI